MGGETVLTSDRHNSTIYGWLFFFVCSGVTSTPRGAAVNRTWVKILETPFRSLRALNAHPSQLEIGVLSSSMGVASPSS